MSSLYLRRLRLGFGAALCFTKWLAPQEYLTLLSERPLFLGHSTSFTSGKVNTGTLPRLAELLMDLAAVHNGSSPDTKNAVLRSLFRARMFTHVVSKAEAPVSQVIRRSA